MHIIVSFFNPLREFNLIIINERYWKWNLFPRDRKLKLKLIDENKLVENYYGILLRRERVPLEQRTRALPRCLP